MRRLLFSLLIMVATSLSLVAHDFEADGIRYDINPDSTTVTVSGKVPFNGLTEYQADIYIPSTVSYQGKQYTVTRIGYKAFSYCRLDTISIPNSVTVIDSHVFHNSDPIRIIVADDNPVYDSRDNCNGIIETATNKLIYGFAVTQIPNTVTEIGSNAYSYTNTVNITIPSSVTRIDDWAFYECRDLISIDLGNSVTSIGASAFADCSALAGIHIPRSVISIGIDAFVVCSSLSYITVEEGNPVYDSRDNCNAIISTASNALLVGCSSTIIPNTVTKIGDSAFDDRNGLINITIPTSVTVIDRGAFCGAALERIDIPNSVTEVGNYAFSSCYNMSELTIGSGLKRIYTYSFYACSKMASITVSEDNPKYDSRDGCNAIIETASNKLIYGCANTVIPNSVTSIGAYAFTSNYGVKQIDIPSSVTYIYTHAFSSCLNLKRVICRATTPPDGYSDAFTYFNNVTLFVPEEAIEAYRSHSLWGQFTDIRPIGSNKTGTPHIGEEGQFTLCLENNESDPDATIYYALSVGDYWQEYTGAIEYHDFGYCYQQDISFFAIADGKEPSDTVEYTFFVHRYCYDFIDNGIYYLRSNSSEVKVSTEYDLQYRLYYSTPASYSGDIVIPENATNNGRTYTVTEIIPYAFYSCPFMTSVVIPNTVRKIGNNAFEAQITSHLASVVIGNSVESIGANAFNNCRNITQITCKALTPPTMEPDQYDYSYGDYFSCYETATLYVPASAAAAYRAHDQWGRFTHIVALGDGNGDGQITVNDVTRLIDIVLQGEDAPAWADINGDGTVNVGDITALIRLVLSD